MTRTLDLEDWAVIDHVRERTVRVLDFTDKSAGGTGVKVSLKGKWYIATAAHVIPAKHDIRLLVRGKTDTFISTFLDRRVDRDLDIGLLEVSETDAALLGGEFVSNDQIVVEFPLENEWKVVVCGYPGQLIGINEKSIPKGKLRTYEFRSMAFFTGTITHSNWPTEGLERALDDHADVFIKFSESAGLEQINFEDATPTIKFADVGAFNPAGLSGGGIWADSRPQPGKLWSPKPLLLAIDYSVHKSDGWMRGTRIGKWAELAGFAN